MVVDHVMSFVELAIVQLVIVLLVILTPCDTEIKIKFDRKEETIKIPAFLLPLYIGIRNGLSSVHSAKIINAPDTNTKPITKSEQPRIETESRTFTISNRSDKEYLTIVQLEPHDFYEKFKAEIPIQQSRRIKPKQTTITNFPSNIKPDQVLWISVECDSKWPIYIVPTLANSLTIQEDHTLVFGNEK